MHAARPHIAHFHAVIVVEHVLHAQIPLNRVRQHLIRNVGRGERARVGLRQLIRSGSNGDGTIFQEVGNVLTNVDVNGGLQLGWLGVSAEVIEQDIVTHTEAGADRGFPGLSRRPGQAKARREILLLRARLAELDQARHVGDGVQALQLVTPGHTFVFVADPEIQC